MTLAVSQSNLAVPVVDDRPRIGLGIVIWLFLISALIGRLVYLTRPFNSDASMFIYAGKVIAEGGRFGHEFVDNKFPSVGLMTGVAWRGFGTNWTSYVLLQAAMSLLAVGMLARVMRRHAGENAAIATGCFALVLLNFSTIVFGGFQLETIQVFFAVLAAAAAVQTIDDATASDAFVVGLCAGCAAMIKPTGASVLGAMFFALLASRRMRFKQIVGALLGLSIPVMVVIWYLILNDTLSDVPAMFRQISRYASQSAWELRDLYKLFIVAALLGFPFVVRAWVSRRDRLPGKATRGVVIFAIAWMALELIGVVLQRRMYAYHFLVLTAPAAMLFGLVPRTSRAVALAAALGPAAVLSALGAWRAFDPVGYGQRPHVVSSYLMEHAQPGDAVWREDGARVLLETNLKSGSRFPLTFLFTNYDQAPLDYGKIILSDFETNRPRYIVLFTNFESWLAHQCEYYTELRRRPIRRENYLRAWRDIRAYVDTHYVFAADLGEETVYQRADELQDSRPRDR